MSGPLTWLDPGVERYLLVEDGELMRDQVTRHWAASVWPGIRFGVGLWILAGAFVFTSWFFWVVLVLSLAVVVNAGWALAGQFRIVSWSRTRRSTGCTAISTSCARACR